MPDKRQQLEKRGRRVRPKRRETREQEPRWVERKTCMALALAGLAGVMVFVGFVGVGVFPLAWVALVPVLVAVRDEPLKRTFLYGMVFGTIAHGGGYYWIAHMLEQFGGFPPLLAYLGLFVLCAYRVQRAHSAR